MSELFAACHLNKFPTLSVLCDYGLDGRDGINPIELFTLYKNAINAGIDACTLEHAMIHDKLYDIVGIRVNSGYNK